MAAINNVNPQQMISTANYIKEEIEEWNQAVNQIYNLQSELDAMWDGTANDAFNAQWAEDREKYKRLSELMREYCMTIINAANLYSEREAEVTRMINSEKGIAQYAGLIIDGSVNPKNFFVLGPGGNKPDNLW